MRVTVQIAGEVAERLPGFSLALGLVCGLNNRTPSEAVGTFWAEAWRQAGEAAAQYGNAQSHPRVKPWREAWRAMGVSSKEYPSSIEALLRRAMKGGEPFSISPLVDLYNAVSLRHTMPAGAFDLAELGATQRPTIELRLTREGDTFTALGSEQTVDVPAGELAYAAENHILTRHLVWRQSRLGLVTPETQDALFVSESLGPLGMDAAGEVVADLSSALQRYFGVTMQGAVLQCAAGGRRGTSLTA